MRGFSHLGSVKAKRVFRLGVALGVLFAFGCAPAPTLEELEAQAEITGDWSAVQERERLIAKRAARRPPSCPGGKVSLCESTMGTLRCRCVAKDAMSSVFVRR